VGLLPQPRGLRSQRPDKLKPAQRRAAPQRQRGIDPLAGPRRVPGRTGLARGVQQLLDPCGIDLRWIDAQHVSPVTRLKAAGQQPTQP
jgi:hypothetical protein